MGSNFGKSYSITGRSDKDRVFFIAAAGLALSLVVVLIVVLNFRAANATQTQAMSVNEPQIVTSVGTVTLYAPERLIQAGQRLSEFKFKETYWPRNQVPDGAVRDLSEIASLYASQDLQMGVPLARSMVTKDMPATMLPVTPGNRAVSIEVNETSSVEGFALPGTRVDVVLTYYSNSELLSKIIVQNARVLSSGGNSTLGVDRALPGQGRSVRTMTLDVSTQDALKISTSKQLGQLSLMMRSQGDNSGATTVEMSVNKLEDNKAKPQNAQQTCRQGGKIKMGGKEYHVNCDGSISELVEAGQ